MHRFFGRFALSVIVGMLSSAPHTLGQNQQMTVSVHSDVRIPHQILIQSEKEASLIYARAGIDVHFVDCTEGVPDVICNGRYEAGDLAVRITSHTSHLISDNAFGVAWLDEEGRGTYADVFWNRALELSMNSEIDLGKILGCVMAHEIGHLLLGANSHAPAGIMRAHWGPAELSRLAMGSLGFLPGEIRKIHARVAPRLVLTSRKGSSLGVEP